MTLPATRASDAATAPATATATTDPNAQEVPPPAKRARREYPWRAEFEREFGVRPIQVDAASGDAVLVECRFCVSFGREPPSVPPAPAVNKAGQPVKSRARTRNVAHWKAPFRTDNMRSHHLQQHARKWDEYAALLEQVKKQQLQSASNGDDAADEPGDGAAKRASLLHRLYRFFGAPESEQHTVAAPAAAAATTQATAAATAEPALAEAVLLPTTTNTAIVDTVLPVLIDIPSAGDADSPEESASVTPLLTPVRATSSSGLTDDAVVTQYAVSSGPVRDLRGVLGLFEAGLRFGQVAEVARSLYLGEAATFGRGEVAEVARALVASTLERVAQLIAASWTYSIRLTVHVPSSDRAPTPVRVSVRVPVDEGRDVQEFHVVTLALHQSSESKERVSAFLPVLFAALDRKFEQKLLNLTVDGATHCLGVHADLAARVVRPLLSEPVVTFYDGHQGIHDAIQWSWALFRDQSDPQASFVDTLLEIIARARADSALVASHHHCPLVQVHDARSVMRSLVWLIPRRDALVRADIDAPLWWWLAAHVFLEVWMDCIAATSDNLNGAQRYDHDASRGIIEQLTKSLTDRCGITIAKGKEKDAEDKTSDVSSTVVDYNEKSRVASVRSTSTGSRLTWASKDMAYCLRALNVSTRRMFGELAKDSALLLTTERQISRLVLLLVTELQQRQQSTSSSASIVSSPPPPTLPLELAAINPANVVDFVETHSRRLEMAFPTVFLDVASREIRDLQALLASNEQLRAELERAAGATGELGDFAASWALLPQLSALRTLAAGLATARPAGSSALTVDSQLLAFGRAENDVTPRGVLADLALEAHAHAQQLPRLQRAARAIERAESLVV